MIKEKTLNLLKKVTMWILCGLMSKYVHIWPILMKKKGFKSLDLKPLF